MKRWPLTPWNLGDYVEKVLKNYKKMAQKLKIFTKIYCTSGLAMLESTPLGDFDPLESTNLGILFYFILFSLPFHLLVNYVYIIQNSKIQKFKN